MAGVHSYCAPEGVETSDRGSLAGTFPAGEMKNRTGGSGADEGVRPTVPRGR